MEDRDGSRADRARRVADVLRQRIVDGAYEGVLPDERALGLSSEPPATPCARR